MLSAPADELSDHAPSTFSDGSHEGPFVVRRASDVFELMGGRCTIRDVQILWRILRDEGCLRIEEDRAVIALPTREALHARCVRAKIAGRRQRSMLGRYDVLM